MSVATAAAYKTFYTKAAFHFMPAFKVNDRTVIIRMNAAVSLTFTDGADFRLRLVIIHVGIENKF